ncbi:perforin-1-like [Osmerus mordax]|uniref:perforin-1-like n=1 Tax=Osmerus mordax TaxID=8014 RepID=UPI0035100C76
MFGIRTALLVLWLCGALLLPPAQPACTTGRAAECKNTPSAPGTDLAGEGFDVVTMERKRAYVIDVDTWKKDEDGGCTLCDNPYMDGNKQKLPAAVVDWRPLHQCHMKVSSSVYDSSESFVKDSHSEVDASWKVGLDVVSPQITASMVVGGTHSRVAKTVMSQSKQDKYSFIKQDVHCSYYSYRLIEKPPLHPEFSRSLNNLPLLYTDQTKPEYKHFLNTFGTHFIHKVQLGGRVKSVTSLRVCQASLEGYKETEVKDCLEAEASVATTTGTADLKTETKFCKQDLKKRDTKESFHNTFKERFTEVVGGQSDGSAELLFAKTGSDAFSNWLGTLKTTPDIITYSMSPLHRLVKNEKKSAGLKKAVEDYILESALALRCSDKCTGSSNPSARDTCQCVCQANQQTTSQCCPQERGLARLTVKVMRAKGLFGDTMSQTDAFVKVIVGTKAIQTTVIQDNDNPRWNQQFDMGMNWGKVSLDSKLKVEVWDEDKHWWKSWDDLLGSCSKPLKQGTHEEMCPMNHGTIFFSYTVECAAGLGGPTCSEHVPSPMASDLSDLYTSRNSLNVTSEFLAQVRAGQTQLDPLTFIRKQKGARLHVLNEL